MSAVSVTPETTLDDVHIPLPLRGLVTGSIAFVLIGLMAMYTSGETFLNLGAGGTWLPELRIGVPARETLLGLLVIPAGFTAFAWVRAQARKPVQVLPWVILTVGFILAFLVWSGAGRNAVIPVTSLLAGGLGFSVPLVFGALSGVVCERVGVVNIAIEGQLLAGAFVAVVVANLFHTTWVGLIGAPIAGALIGVLLAWFAINHEVDQIIVGVVLNVLVVGLTSFLFSTVLTEAGSFLNAGMRLPNIAIPLLSQIPILGPVLFNQTILVYLGYVFLVLLQIYLFRSQWGLRLRAVGEHPRAADTVGINVNRTRWINTILGGALAGLGGAYFTIGSGLAFGKEMTAGNGYIALAAMILGRWNPMGALVAALMFGFSRNIANTLSIIGAPVPSQFLLMIPYVVTVLAVAGFVGRVTPPAAENIPYKSGH
ncbi:ABC transporter permease [Stomatohabitans albus]|uniref:ABC transporter permease n=1 Tax=Stomatohabitans albus TaxID=3110766 RepID=UPI00300C1D46